MEKYSLQENFFTEKCQSAAGVLPLRGNGGWCYCLAKRIHRRLCLEKITIQSSPFIDLAYRLSCQLQRELTALGWQETTVLDVPWALGIQIG